MEGDRHILLFEKLCEVFPVVLLLFQLKAVVELVHLDLIWVVSGHDLREDPAVAKVSLWVGDLVSQIKRLDPLSQLARQIEGLGLHRAIRII